MLRKHISGNHPKGAGTLFHPKTTRQELAQAIDEVVDSKTFIKETEGKLVFEKVVTVHGVADNLRVVVVKDTAVVISSYFTGKGYR